MKHLGRWRNNHTKHPLKHKIVARRVTDSSRWLTGHHQHFAQPMNDCTVYTSSPDKHGSFNYLRNYVQSIFMALIGCLIKLKAALSGQWPLTFPDKASRHIFPRQRPVSAGLVDTGQWKKNWTCRTCRDVKPQATRHLSVKDEWIHSRKML